MLAKGMRHVFTYGFQGLYLASLAPGLYDPDLQLEAARLYGNMNAYAYFFVDLLVGTPPQRVSVIVDTGSTVCAFPCAGCNHCGQHIDPPFNFSKSSTASWTGCGNGCSTRSCHNGHCSYYQGYTEGSSISGFWFEDLLSVGDLLQGNPPVRSFMGCHESENNLFYTQRANGILGMGPGRGGQPTILEELFKDHPHIQNNIFTICLAEWGGRLVVGGTNESYHRGTIQYVPVNVQSGFYAVALDSMSVGSIDVRGPWGKTIVDSGTTYTYMATENYRRLRDGIESYCRERFCGTMQNDCWTAIPNNDVSIFPDITVVLSSKATVWESRAYLMKRRDGEYCYAFADDGNGANTVLGASWMLHKDVIFDMRQLLLGVVQANCPEYKERPAALEEVGTTPPPTRQPSTVSTSINVSISSEVSITSTTSNTHTTSSISAFHTHWTPVPTLEPTSTTTISPVKEDAQMSDWAPVPPHTPRPTLLSGATSTSFSLQDTIEEMPIAAASMNGFGSNDRGFNSTEEPVDGSTNSNGPVVFTSAAAISAATLIGACFCCLAMRLAWRCCLRATDWDHSKLRDIDESGMPPEIVGHHAEADIDNSETFVICDDVGEDDAWSIEDFPTLPDSGHASVQ